MRTRFVAAAAGLAACVTPVQAAFFSFASDSSDRAWTFVGEHAPHNEITDGTTFDDPTNLLIDDGNGGLPPLSFSVNFNFHAHLHHIGSSPIGGGKFLHSYHVEGDAGWYADSGPILTLEFIDSIMTVVGGAASWDSAASIFGEDAYSTVVYTSHIHNPAYGLFVGDSIGPDDFAFTLTTINTSGVIPYDFDPAFRGVSLGADMLPDEDWYAEGSFSGSAPFVPAPGAGLVMAGAALALARRRR